MDRNVLAEIPPCADCLIYARCRTQLYHSMNRFETIREDLVPKCNLIAEYIKNGRRTVEGKKAIMNMQKIEDYFDV